MAAHPELLSQVSWAPKRDECDSLSELGQNLLVDNSFEDADQGRRYPAVLLPLNSDPNAHPVIYLNTDLRREAPQLGTLARVIGMQTEGKTKAKDC